MNEALGELIEDGTIDELYQEYFATDAPAPVPRAVSIGDERAIADGRTISTGGVTEADERGAHGRPFAFRTGIKRAVGAGSS